MLASEIIPYVQLRSPPIPEFGIWHGALFLFRSVFGRYEAASPLPSEMHIESNACANIATCRHCVQRARPETTELQNTQFP